MPDVCELFGGQGKGPIFKIFSPKIWQKLTFFAQTTATPIRKL
jgi:hypothetical protein